MTAKEVEARIKAYADMASRRLGVSRRTFLASSGGIAASFLAMNEAHGADYFKVGKDELFEPEAHARNAPPRDLFVLDEQPPSHSNGKAPKRAMPAIEKEPDEVEMESELARV